MTLFRTLVTLVFLALAGYFFGAAVAYGDNHETLRLNSKNTVVFRGVVDEDSTTNALVDLAALVSERGAAGYPIYLVLDSPGGDVEAGLQFIEVAKTLPNIRTVTIFAASMASGIVEGLPGSRLITGSGTLMFHRASGRIGGQFEVGEMETRLEAAKEMVRGMERTNAARLGISLVEYKAKVVNEYWLSANKSLADNAADKIVDIVCAMELIDSRVLSESRGMFGSTTLEYSGCPTFRYPIPSKKNAKAVVGL